MSPPLNAGAGHHKEADDTLSKRTMHQSFRFVYSSIQFVASIIQDQALACRRHGCIHELLELAVVPPQSLGTRTHRPAGSAVDAKSSPLNHRPDWSTPVRATPVHIYPARLAVASCLCFRVPAITNSSVHLRDGHDAQHPASTVPILLKACKMSCLESAWRPAVSGNHSTMALLASKGPTVREAHEAICHQFQHPPEIVPAAKRHGLSGDAQGGQLDVNRLVA
jgi:hypothetical protein